MGFVSNEFYFSDGSHIEPLGLSHLVRKVKLNLCHVRRTLLGHGTFYMIHLMGMKSPPRQAQDLSLMLATR